MRAVALLLGPALVTFAACGGQTSGKSAGGGSDSGSDGTAGGSSGGGSGGSSGGSSGSSSGASFGCPNGFTTTQVPIKPDVCAPQLSGVTSCMGVACSWQTEIPCPADGGASDDAGSPCMDACNATAPMGAGPAGFCTTVSSQGGTTTFACGACGI